MLISGILFGLHISPIAIGIAVLIDVAFISIYKRGD